MNEDREIFAAAMKEALRRGFTAAILLLGLTGTATLLFTTLSSQPEADAGAGLVRFFSYFTIQSTIAVSIWSAFQTFQKPPSPRLQGNREETVKNTVHLALLVSSLLTAGGYYALLDASWRPEGLSAFGNLLVHAVVPVLLFLEWLVFERKGRFRLVSVAAVLALPAFHMCAVLLLGSRSGRYPYYFLDPVALGTIDFLRNALLFAVLFILTGGLLWIADQLMLRLRRSPQMQPEQEKGGR
jgi:hypothetical protein